MSAAAPVITPRSSPSSPAPSRRLKRTRRWLPRVTANLADYANVSVVMDRSAGSAKGAPYDLIFVNGAVEEVPGVALFAQLHEGGRSRRHCGYGGSARATVFVSERGAVFRKRLLQRLSSRPPGFAKAREFVFWATRDVGCR